MAKRSGKKKSRNVKSTASASSATAKSAPTLSPVFTENQETRIALILTISLYLLYVVWGLSSNGTWDEDCPTRYYNTLAALTDPRMFISLWNRPLFILIFFLPVQLGKASIPILMSAISAFGAMMLFRSARALKMRNAFLAVPFLMLQPYFLGVGRDAMTEPLAAVIICIGLYFAVKKKWIAFALIGALLPLARTEMATLLPLWAMVLILNKQWKIIPLLAVGMIAWNLAGWLIDGDPLYIITQTLYGSPEENRYGHQPFNTYFTRYFYVIGPVIFFFLILGITERIKSRSWQWLIMGQFVIGLLVYTLFAWKINLGQSAGFLRNLIPLSPLAAILALYGINFWFRGMFLRKDRWIILGAAVAAVALTAIFFRNKIRIHHLLTTHFDPYNLPIVGFLGLITLLLVLFYKGEKNKRSQRVLLSGVCLLLAGHTLVTEPPDANMNPERDMIDEVVTAYQKLGLEQAPLTFCSHGWFFWAGHYNKNDARFKPMRLDDIHSAPAGSVVIWENHFSNRLGADVSLEALQQDNSLMQVAQFYSEDFGKSADIFVKRSDGESASAYLDTAIQKAPDVAELYLMRYQLDKQQQQMSQAGEDLNRALTLAPENAYAKWIHADYLKNEKQYDAALKETDWLIAKNENNLNAFMLRGIILYDTKQYLDAIKAFAAVIKNNNNVAEAYYNTGLCYAGLKDNKQACANFTKALNLHMSQAQAAVDKYCGK